VGGTTTNNGSNALATAQIYNPQTNSWSTDTPSLTTARYGHTLTLLPGDALRPDGRALVVGGYTGSTVLSTAQIYNISIVELTKNGLGELNLGSSSNSFIGPVQAEGVLTVGSSCLELNNGPLGNSNKTISINGTLKYNGSSPGIISRTIGLNGATPAIESVGTGAVQIDSPLVQILTSSKTLSLKGTNSGENIISSAISDSVGATSLAKEGAGSWKLTGANIAHTGNTTISAGALHFGGTARTLASNIIMTGGELQNDSATLETNLTLDGDCIVYRAPLAGVKNLTVNSGASTIHLVDGSTYTGASTVALGAILNLKTDANPATSAAGKVLGDSNVTVSGEIRTRKGLVQKGSARFGGNLTFNGGSKMFIGGV
jgi:autotransporter-associated beta strand protein